MNIEVLKNTLSPELYTQVEEATANVEGKLKRSTVANHNISKYAPNDDI